MRHTKTTRQRSQASQAITTVSGSQQASLFDRQMLRPYRKLRRLPDWKPREESKETQHGRLEVEDRPAGVRSAEAG